MYSVYTCDKKRFGGNNKKIAKKIFGKALENSEKSSFYLGKKKLANILEEHRVGHTVSCNWRPVAKLTCFQQKQLSL